MKKIYSFWDGENCGDYIMLKRGKSK